jgi:SAM-dependent methyltransferase
MKHPNEKRFEDFFEEGKYVVLKNYLYNYQIRKRTIQGILDREDPRLVLEVGSGLSPMITNRDAVVYSELSFRALATLKRQHDRGMHVVADGTRLPFKDGAFSHTVCSEVLEHVEDDQTAVNELGRILEPGGVACITVPHRQFYFAADDRFVRHFRRYEDRDILGKVESAGLRVRRRAKVLGPLEKITMFSTVMAFSLLQRLTGSSESSGKPSRAALLIAPIFKWANRAFALLARLDARIMPWALSTVILIEGEKPKP